MGVVNLARAVADPDEVRRGVVVLLVGSFTVSLGRGTAVRPRARSRLLKKTGKSLLIVEKKTLVAGEELYGLELAGTGVDGLEKAERLLDAGRDGRVLVLELRVANMAESPVKRSVEVCDAGGDGCADVVERGGRVVVGLDETAWIDSTVLNAETIDNVTLETRHLLAINNLHRARPRLRILPSHTSDTHNRLVNTPDENDAHLQKKLDLALDGALATVIEELGAVTTLEKKGVALCDIAEVGFQSDDLVGVDERGEAGELVDGRGERSLVRVVGGLLDGL